MIFPLSFFGCTSFLGSLFFSAGMARDDRPFRVTPTPPFLGRRTPHPVWRARVCMWLHSPVQEASWSSQAGRPTGRVLVRLSVPVAVLLFLRPPLGCVCPWCGFVLFFGAPLRSTFRCLRTWVPRASALCACPPRPLFFLARAPLVSAFGLYPALGALGLGALLLPAPPPASFFFFAPALFGGSRPLVPLALTCFGWVSFSSLMGGLWCSVCVVRWCLCPPPPPQRLLLVFCGVPRLVLSCRRLVSPFLCGLRCFLVFFCAVLCWCADAWLFGVLSCCVVGFVACRLV